MSGDKDAGRIDTKGESNVQNHALNNMWSKGGDMQTYKLQAQTPKMDDSILPTVTFSDKIEKSNGTKTFTVGVTENVNGTATTGKPTYNEPQFSSELPSNHHKRQHRTHQAHAENSFHETQVQTHSDNGRPFHSTYNFPAMRTRDGQVTPSGHIELTIQPGQYREGARLGDVPIPPDPHRNNFYNKLMDAHYQNGMLVGTPAHVNARGQVEAYYPQQIGIRAR